MQPLVTANMPNSGRKEKARKPQPQLLATKSKSIVRMCEIAGRKSQSPCVVESADVPTNFPEEPLMQHDDAILDRLAREILMVDSQGQSLIPQYLSILEHGLPKPLPPDVPNKDVVVIGAGIAGLVAGKLLKDAGYNVTIVEANDNRIGGRVKTFHATPERGTPFQDPKQYGEAGAMRIPDEHKLVNKLIDIMGLRDKAQLFYNVDVAKDDASKKTFRTWLKTNG